MPSRKGQVMDNPIARSIFSELELYAKDKQFYPLQNALYGHMTRFIKGPDGEKKRCYDLTLGTFNWWFGRLVEDGYIQIDRETRSIRAVHLQIVEKDGPNPMEKSEE